MELVQQEWDGQKYRDRTRYDIPCRNPECNRPKVPGRSTRYCETCAAQQTPKRRSLLRRYNLTLERFEAILTSQGGRCAICRAVTPGGAGDWHVDHDHRCCAAKNTSCGSCIRGLLCAKCNGHVLPVVEGPMRRAAMRYLKRFRETVNAAEEWEDNGALIADVARLGYIGGDVLDTTYGEGGFWTRWKPKHLLVGCTPTAVRAWQNGVGGPAVEEAFDFRKIGYADAQFDTVVFDPPYKFNGTPAMGDMDKRYGTDKPLNESETLSLIYGGLCECARVCKPGGHVLVKCMDQVVSGRVVWQTDLITRVAENGLGLAKVDRFDMLRTPIPQPPGRAQVHARRNYSTLLVFRKGK